jgi:hypothetical protein
MAVKLRIPQPRSLVADVQVLDVATHKAPGRRACGGVAE